MKGCEKSLKQDDGYEDTVFLDDSRNYVSYLENSIYLVQKDGLRGAVAIGAARLIRLLDCKFSQEKIMKVTQRHCKYLCSTFSTYHETEIQYRGPESKDNLVGETVVTLLEGGGMLTRKNHDK